MSTPPGDSQDPNQPHRDEPGGFGQQPPPPPQGQQPPPYGHPSDSYASYPPPSAPPPGGYGQQPENHPKATLSLVLGIVAVVCCSLTAPFAWVIGKRTMNEIDASGGRLGGRGLAQAGYILGIIGTILLVLSVVILVFAIAVGGFSFEVGSTTTS